MPRFLPVCALLLVACDDPDSTHSRARDSLARRLDHLEAQLDTLKRQVDTLKRARAARAQRDSADRDSVRAGRP